MHFYQIISLIISLLALTGVVFQLVSFQFKWQKIMDEYTLYLLLGVSILNMVLVVVGMEMELPEFSDNEQSFYNQQQITSFFGLIEFAVLMTWSLMRKHLWLSKERFFFSLIYLMATSFVCYTYLLLDRLV